MDEIVANQQDLEEFKHNVQTLHDYWLRNCSFVSMS